MVDDTLRRNIQGAAAAGLAVGFYHYCHPELNDAKVEAQHFFKTVWGLTTKLPLVHDVEGAASKIGKAALTKWCLNWLQEVERLTGRDVMMWKALPLIDFNPLTFCWRDFLYLWGKGNFPYQPPVEVTVIVKAEKTTVFIDRNYSSVPNPFPKPIINVISAKERK